MSEHTAVLRALFVVARHRRGESARSSAILALAGAALLGACTTVGPDFKRPAGALAGRLEGRLAASRWPPTRGACASGQSQTWWRSFNDPVLDQLIAEAQRVNPNVRTAGLRIMEARAQLGIAGSTLYPQVQQVTGDAAAASARAAAGAPDTTAVSLERRAAHQLGARLLGPVPAQHRGRRRRLPRQHRPVRRPAGADGRPGGQPVLLDPHRWRRGCVIASENAALQKRSLEIAERLFKSGNESELDVQQARAQYLGTLATIPQLESSLRQTQNALSTLLARPPGPLPEMAAGKERDPAGRARRHRRHAGRSAAPPPGRARRGTADGCPVRPDRRERGRPLSVDLAAGIGGPVGDVAGRLDRAC